MARRRLDATDWEEIAERLRRMLAETFGQPDSPPSETRAEPAPHVEVTEDRDAWLLEVELPRGTPRDPEIEAWVREGVLMIRVPRTCTPRSARPA